MLPVIHTKPGEKIVTYFSTHHLYDVLPAAYKSLLHFTPDVHVYCFIEDDTLPYPVPPQITCVNVSGQTLFPPSGPNYTSNFTYMILLKAALTKIFPDADKALILDVDTIVHADISDLWIHDLANAYYAAVIEPRNTMKWGLPYANFGVTMLNLSKLRDSGMDDLIIHELNTVRHALPEQDAFCILCMNKMNPLPSKYNAAPDDITAPTDTIIIEHFAGVKAEYWRSYPIVQYWLNRKE